MNNKFLALSLLVTISLLGDANQALGNEFSIATTTDTETAFDIAFDGTNYLVAIGAETIGAQLVSQSGMLVGSFISTGVAGGCCGSAKGSGLPHVAFDGINYLLIWTDEDVFGQFITPSGSTLGDPFVIVSNVNDGSTRGIAYGDNNYVVVYSRSTSESGDTSYFSRTVTTDGVVGSELTISSGLADFSIRAIAFGETNYLIVWTDDENDSEVRGRLLSGSNSLGQELSINASPAPSDNPSTVSFDGTNFLVVWNDEVAGQGSHEWDLFGQLISQDGDLLGGVISVTESPGSQLAPFITFDGVNYLVTWTDMANDENNDGVCDSDEQSCWDIKAQYISTTGEKVGSEITITNNDGNQVLSPIAFGGGKILVAWGVLESDSQAFEDAATDDIYGDLLAASDPDGNSYSIDVSEAAPITGLWWNENESGWGVTLTQQFDIIFVTIFTYDTSGFPIWYVASNCVISGDSCTGDLYEVTGGSPITSDWDGVGKSVNLVGNVSFTFSDNDTGSMNVTINGVSGSKAITRQVWSTLSPGAPMTALWWNENESGWGVTLTQQTDIVFVTIFTYNTNGFAYWYVASNCVVAGNGCAGELYEVTGVTSLLEPFSEANKVVTPVGNVAFLFDTDDSGTMTIDFNGVEGSKQITKQIWATQ